MAIAIDTNAMIQNLPTIDKDRHVFDRPTYNYTFDTHTYHCRTLHNFANKGNNGSGSNISVAMKRKCDDEKFRCKEQSAMKQGSKVLGSGKVQKVQGARFRKCKVRCSENARCKVWKMQGARCKVQKMQVARQRKRRKNCRAGHREISQTKKLNDFNAQYNSEFFTAVTNEDRSNGTYLFGRFRSAPFPSSVAE